MKKELIYYGNTIKIPDDVRRKIHLNIFLKALSFVLLEALTITAAYFFSKGSGLLASQITYTIAALIPFGVTRVPFCFIDKTYVGQVEKVEVATVSNTETAMTLLTKNIVTIYVRLESGDVVVKKVNEGRVKNSAIVDEYKVGTVVIHLYGTKYIVPYPENKTKALNKKCFICGQTSPNENDKCYGCGHTLISNMNE